MKNLLWYIVVGVSAGGYWYWGNIQDEVISYNDGVIALLDEDNRHYEGYVNQLNKYYDGETVDVAAMRESLVALNSSHRDVITKTAQVAIPDYETCNVFHQAFVQYLENSSGIIATYGEITDYIDSHNPATEEDINEVDAALSEFLIKDDTLFVGITDAQKAMSKKFMFDLE